MTDEQEQNMGEPLPEDERVRLVTGAEVSRKALVSVWRTLSAWSQSKNSAKDFVELRQWVCESAGPPSEHLTDVFSDLLDHPDDKVYLTRDREPRTFFRQIIEAGLKVEGDSGFLVNPLSTEREYLKLKDAVWEEINNETRQMLTEDRALEKMMEKLTEIRIRKRLYKPKDDDLGRN